MDGTIKIKTFQSLYDYNRIQKATQLDTSGRWSGRWGGYWGSRSVLLDNNKLTLGRYIGLLKKYVLNYDGKNTNDQIISDFLGEKTLFFFKKWKLDREMKARDIRIIEDELLNNDKLKKNNISLKNSETVLGFMEDSDHGWPKLISQRYKKRLSVAEEKVLRKNFKESLVKEFLKPGSKVSLDKEKLREKQASIIDEYLIDPNQKTLDNFMKPKAEDGKSNAIGWDSLITESYEGKLNDIDAETLKNHFLNFFGNELTEYSIQLTPELLQDKQKKLIDKWLNFDENKEKLTHLKEEDGNLNEWRSLVDKLNQGAFNDEEIMQIKDNFWKTMNDRLSDFNEHKLTSVKLELEKMDFIKNQLILKEERKTLETFIKDNNENTVLKLYFPETLQILIDQSNDVSKEAISSSQDKEPSELRGILNDILKGLSALNDLTRKGTQWRRGNQVYIALKKNVDKTMKLIGKLSEDDPVLTEFYNDLENLLDNNLFSPALFRINDYLRQGR